MLHGTIMCNGSNQLWRFIRKIQRTITGNGKGAKKGGMPDLLKN